MRKGAINIGPFILLLLFISVSTVKAQQLSYNISYLDSLVLDKGSRFVSNPIVFKNNLKDTLVIDCKVTPPVTWQASNKQQQIKLAPNEEYAIPVSVIPSSSTPAEWMPFQMQVTTNKDKSSKTYTFWGKTSPVLRYNAYLISRSEQLSGDKRDLVIKLYVSNTGNLAAKYIVQFKNYYLNLQKEVPIYLKPNIDTLINFPLTVPKELWKGLKNEVISIKIFDSTQAVKLLLFDLTRSHTEVKQHRSAFQTLPIEFESGALLNDKQLTYFGVLKGKVNLKENMLLNFSYRTKEMGAYNQIQNDVVNLNLVSPKLILYAGQMTDAKNFTAFGNGIKGSYLLKDKEIYFSGTLHNNNFYFKNDQFEAGFKHIIGKVKLDQSISANFDPDLGTNSYLFLNKADIIKQKNVGLSVNGGVGYDQTKKEVASIKSAPVLSGGYDAFYMYNKFQITSSIQHNSKYFPGLNKGLRTQNHLVSWRAKKLILSGFFQSNQRLFSVFRDSIYNSDFLSYNTQKLGVYAGAKLEKVNLGVSSGRFGQFGSGSSNSLDKYNFLENFFYWQPSKKIKTNFSSFNAYGDIDNKSQKVWVNSTTAGIYMNRFGLTGIYTKNPQLINDSGTKRLQRYIETMNLTPSLNFSIMKRFFFSLSYTLSQTSYDENITSYGSGSFSYTGKRNGLALSIYGIVPVTKSNANSPGLKTSYFTLSVKKKLEVPLFFKRKYYTLKVVPFLDENNNEKKDVNESYIKNRLININSTAFLTDKNGTAVYRNINKGSYTVDFNTVKGIEGYVPAKGFTQSLQLKGNTTLQVPFKKSKVIAGSIAVELDSLSNMKFTPDGIKVIARDSSGNVYSALTNERGSFTINVPANVYVVSLNPEAFDDKMKPEIMAFSIDLTTKENESVHFIIKQQKRKVRILKN